MFVAYCAYIQGSVRYTDDFDWFYSVFDIAQYWCILKKICLLQTYQIIYTTLYMSYIGDNVLCGCYYVYDNCIGHVNNTICKWQIQATQTHMHSH